MLADRAAEEKRAAEENEARIKKQKAERKKRLDETTNDIANVISNSEMANRLVADIVAGKIRNVEFI